MIARFRSSVPELFVYFVKFASMARCAAALMWSGVGKSGSPAPKSTTSIPWAFILMASDATFMVGDTAMRPVLSARFISQALSVSRPAPLVLQAGLDPPRHEPCDGAA